MTLARIALALTLLVSAASLSVGPAHASDSNVEANEKVAYQSIELWMSGSTVKPENIVAQNYINHADSAVSQQSGSRARDLATLKKELKQFHAAFSDVHVTSKEQVAQGNMVATRVVISAVHSGPFLGAKPTGKTVTYDSVEFTRIEDGKIAETWVTWDKYGLFEQIGLIP